MNRRTVAPGVALLVALGLAACRSPVGAPPGPSLEPPPTRSTYVPDEADQEARRTAAGVLGDDALAVRRAREAIEMIDAERRAAGESRTGLLPYAQHAADATEPGDLAYRRASRELLERRDLDEMLRRKVEIEVADDPLALARLRMHDEHQRRVARAVNGVASALGRSILNLAAAPLRLSQALLGIAVAEYTDEPISVRERQALAYWKRFVEEHPEAPESHALLEGIESLQRDWFEMKRDRGVRAAERGIDGGQYAEAFVFADRALRYAPEDREATALLLRAEALRHHWREERRRSVSAAPGPLQEAGDPLARALLVALMQPGGDVETAANALLATQPEDGPLVAEGLFARALARGERGDEDAMWDAYESLADCDDRALARHAAQLMASPSQNPYEAFRQSVADGRADSARFVALGPLADGAHDRNLPRPVEWILEGPALLSTLGGIPTRLLQTTMAPPPARAPAVHARNYLKRYPQGAHSMELRHWLLEYEGERGNWITAYALAEDSDSATREEIERKAAAQALSSARAQERRDLRLMLLRETATRYPDTPAGKRALRYARDEIEHATSQRIRVSRGFLEENPRVAGPAGLGLRPDLLDEGGRNGELHPDGVTLIGGRVLEIALLAPSGDPEDPPERRRQRISADRLARLVSLLEETALRNALLDPLAAHGPDADRDLFFERARLGAADIPDLRPEASSNYAFLGVRERYGMVRTHESILPVDLVIQGSLPSMTVGAFPRLRTPHETPDAVLYR